MGSNVLRRMSFFTQCGILILKHDCLSWHMVKFLVFRNLRLQVIKVRYLHDSQSGLYIQKSIKLFFNSFATLVLKCLCFRICWDICEKKLELKNDKKWGEEKLLFRKIMTVNWEGESWNWLNWGPRRLAEKIRRKV